MFQSFYTTRVIKIQSNTNVVLIKLKFKSKINKSAKNTVITNV